MANYLLPGSCLLVTLIAIIHTCQANIINNLTLYTPLWEEWDGHVARWSLYRAPTFSMVFKPSTKDELSQGIAYLSKNNIRYLATKAGGHGNVPTLGDYQDVVQINMDNFRHAVVNLDKSITIGGGARMEDIIPTLHAAGREMTVGSFPCVGVFGVMLGGGMGRLMGKYGLMSDALLRAEVALWNGSVVEASESVNPDLFWGLRGAGHNLAVVVEATFKTWPDEGGMHYNADMVFSHDSLEGVVAVAKRIIEDGLGPAVFFILGFVFDVQEMQPLLIVNLVSAHDADEGRRVAEMFASTTGPDVPVAANLPPITRVSVEESSVDFAELGSGAALPGVCDLKLRNSLYTASTPSMFDVRAIREAFDSYGALIRAHPLANRSIVLFEAADGRALETVPHDYSAYAHRGRMTTNAIIQATWDGEGDDGPVAAAATSWAKKLRDLLARPDVSGYDRLFAYVNYANEDESPSSLYGYEEWRHRKLTGLKQKYDPHGYFTAYRPVPSDMAGWDSPSSASETASEGAKDEL